MSIIGTGIDIIEISRVERNILRFKNKLAIRILSQQELDQYFINKNCISFLAKKFAGKEAASKALGTGMNYGITFNQIELYTNKLGKPKLRFFKNALKRSKEIKCNTMHVSISDQKIYACALVILEN